MTGLASDSRDTLAQRVREQLTSYLNVREVRMFGGLSFMVDERMVVAAGPVGDLLVRTDPAEYDDLLRRGGTPALMGEHRPIGRGWLAVPGDRIHGDDELAYWVKVGLDSRDADRQM